MKIISSKRYKKITELNVSLQEDYNDLMYNSTLAIDGLCKTNNDLCEEIRQLEENNKQLGNNLTAMEFIYKDHVKEIKYLKSLLTKNNIKYRKEK